MTTTSRPVLPEDVTATLRKDVMQADATAIIGDAAIEALHHAGVYQLFSAGHAGTGDLARSARQIARAHPSAAWNVVVSTTSELLAQRFALHTNVNATWPEGALWAGVFASFASTAQPTADGMDRLEGAWPYASNSAWAQWAILNVAHTELGAAFILVPREAFTIERTWHALGLRATRSDTIHLTLEAVARERFLPAETLFADLPDAAPALRLPVRLLTAFGLAAVALGAAESLLDQLVEQTQRAVSKTVRAASGFPSRGSTQPGLTTTLAEGVSRLTAARVLLDHSATDLDEQAQQAGPISVTVLTETRLSLARVVRDIADAVHELSLVGGSRWCLEGSAAGRAWRDAHVACRHAALSPSVGFNLGGEHLVSPKEAHRSAAAGPLAPSRPS